MARLSPASSFDTLDNLSTVLQMLLSQCYGSLREEVFLGRSASHDDVITQFGHYENWLQSLELFLEVCMCQESNSHWTEFFFIIFWFSI